MFLFCHHIVLLLAAGYPARGRTIEFDSNARFEDRIKKIKFYILSSVNHCTAICFNLVEINKLMLARQNNNDKRLSESRYAFIILSAVHRTNIHVLIVFGSTDKGAKYNSEKRKIIRSSREI